MLRRTIDKILLNTFDQFTATVVSGGLFIKGYGQILAANVVECLKVCSGQGKPKIVSVQPVIPTSCECPYEWGLTVVTIPDDMSYEISETFKRSRFYGYEDPSGGTPTASQTGAAVSANINADPNAEFVAGFPSTWDYTGQTVNFTVGAVIAGATSNATATIIADADAGATGTLTITNIVGTFTPGEAVVDSFGGNGTMTGSPSAPSNVGGLFYLVSKIDLNTGQFYNYNAYTASGTITTILAWVRNFLGTIDMAKMFPIHNWDFGSTPNLPIRGGTYCKYRFKIQTADSVQDISAANHLNGYEQEVEFYANANDVNYAADFHDKLATAFSACTSF